MKYAAAESDSADQIQYSVTIFLYKLMVQIYIYKRRMFLCSSFYQYVAHLMNPSDLMCDFHSVHCEIIRSHARSARWLVSDCFLVSSVEKIWLNYVLQDWQWKVLVVSKKQSISDWADRWLNAKHTLKREQKPTHFHVTQRFID